MKPITKQQLDDTLRKYDIEDINCATIRQIWSVAATLEELSGEKFVHLELGNPGFAAETIGMDAQCEAIKRGVANKYPNIAGIPELKNAASKFLRAFLDINIPAECVVPTIGSMNGCFTVMMLLSRLVTGKDTILFIDPGFPAQHHQAKIVGLNIESFDIYEYRGDKLSDKLDSILSKGNVIAMLYSNPNNPAWTNLTHDELKTIGEMATKHDVIVIEDLAYMGMDFRHDYSQPFTPPYIPTVAKYTDNYLLLVSASKIFSYAGERIATVCFSPKLFHRQYENLASFYDMPSFGDAYIFGTLYASSSGVSHSCQYAAAAMFEAAADGKLNFVNTCSEYGRRAARAKKSFLDNGFNLVYELDGDSPISDGFFFTVGYNGIDGAELQKELLRYGIATIPLKSAGSDQPGVRVTVSMLSAEDQFQALETRLKAFNEQHR